MRRVLIVGLFSLGLSACGDPLSPFTANVAFAIPAGAAVPVGPGSWVIADTLRFFADGTGQQRGTLETRFSSIIRQPTATSFRYERTGSRVAVTWPTLCGGDCDASLITTIYVLDGAELRGQIGSEAVLYRRLSSAYAP